jgi:hypothetical protein
LLRELEAVEGLQRFDLAAPSALPGPRRLMRSGKASKPPAWVMTRLLSRAGEADNLVAIACERSLCSE